MIKALACESVSRGPGRYNRRRALTLVEVLIALAITLLILLSMTQAFTVASREIGIGRNRLLVAERVRDAADLVRLDLERLSLNVRPTYSSAEGQGYLEIVDRPFRDMTFLDSPSNLLGDIDDILMFTAVSPDRPFKGRFDGRIIESTEAEIIYFTRHVDSNGNGVIDYGDQIRLYRRVLLIRPDLTSMVSGSLASNNVVYRSVFRFNEFVNTNGLDPAWLTHTPYAKFLQFNDVSLCRDFDNPVIAFTPEPPAALPPPMPRYRCNSLGTLSHPKNRTAHLNTSGVVMGNGRLEVAGFPHPVLAYYTPAQRTVNTVLDDLIMFGTMAGSDVVLENVVGFDLKVFDPTVPIYRYAGLPMMPHDNGYAAMVASGSVPDGFGCYVDLGGMEYRAVTGVPAGHGLGPVVVVPGLSHHFAHWRSRLLAPQYQAFRNEEPTAPNAGYWLTIMSSYEGVAGGPTYTTWTRDFERDGIDNDGDGLIDEGSDGVPIAGNALSGLRNDRDSAPPYLQPITSVQVTLRAASFNADRQQIRGSDQVMQAEVVVSTQNQ